MCFLLIRSLQFIHRELGLLTRRCFLGADFDFDLYFDLRYLAVVQWHTLDETRLDGLY